MANVRLSVSHLLPNIKRSLKLPSDRLLVQQFDQTLRVLYSMENDTDVCYTVRQTLPELNRIEIAVETVSNSVCMCCVCVCVCMCVRACVLCVCVCVCMCVRVCCVCVLCVCVVCVHVCVCVVCVCVCARVCVRACASMHTDMLHYEPLLL